MARALAEPEPTPAASPWSWALPIARSAASPTAAARGDHGHPNQDPIRRGYDAFSRADMQTLRELFHPDIIWHPPGRSQLAGDHQGIDAVLGYFGQTWS